MKIKEDVRALEAELIDLRRTFHKYPELSWQESRTSEKIYHYLKQLGLAVQQYPSKGVVGFLQGEKAGPTLLLRADMDALPIQEQTQVSYQSVYPGVMHACGHDGHMAMLMIAAKLLKKYKKLIPGNIKFVFQPCEESMGGAKAMISEGVLANPKVDAAMGLHLWSPLKSGVIGIKSGSIMAALSLFSIKVIGQGGHTGYPENAIDPIIAASDIIQKVQLIQTRRMSQLNPTIIMFGKIEGGTKCNIIPDQVLLEGTIRYLNDDNQLNQGIPEKKMKELVQSIAKTHQVRLEMIFNQENKMVINHPGMTSLVRRITEELSGITGVNKMTCTASEDFSEFSHQVPSVFYFLGCGNPEKKSNISHHNPFFNIDEDVLSVGVECHIRSALRFFKEKNLFDQK